MTALIMDRLHGLQRHLKLSRILHIDNEGSALPLPAAPMPSWPSAVKAINPGSIRHLLMGSSIGALDHDRFGP